MHPTYEHIVTNLLHENSLCTYHESATGGVGRKTYSNLSIYCVCLYITLTPQNTQLHKHRVSCLVYVWIR